MGGASTVNGAAIQQWEANGTAAQNWSVIVYDDSSFALVNDASGKVVDVPSGNAVANAKLQSYAANGSKAQMWGIAVAQNTREMLDSFAMKHRQDLADEWRCSRPLWHQGRSSMSQGGRNPMVLRFAYGHRMEPVLSNGGSRTISMVM